MSLQHTAHYNDLSPKLRKELEAKVLGFGKLVRYKFDISNPNPDPTFHNGKVLWPHLYTLDPAVFNINDPYEDREGKQRSKRIALIDRVDEKGLPDKFRKIRVYDRQKGILALQLDNPEDFDTAIFLEIHPKLSGGRFADPTKRQVVSRIDEQAAATSAREVRSAKSKALRAAEELSDKGVIDFADAMLWDSSQDLPVLRNMVEEQAETTPEFFNDLIAGKRVEYQAAVKQALNKQIIAFDPAEYKMYWMGNRQTIVLLPAAGEKNEVEKFAEYLENGGEKAATIYKKIKSLIEGKAVVA